MAESCDKAFGRYLRTLRERRGLTLDAVASLSQTFPETIHKGYLSRCENGFQKPAFSKIIALSRIYEVPADVLVERMELDMELDRLGGPETAGLEFSFLILAGRKALQEGFRWNGYGYLRDAVDPAKSAAIRPVYRDRVEQVAMAHQNVATAARALGRNRFALHEFQHVESSDALAPRFQSLVLERIACCYRYMGELSLAESYAERAVKEMYGSDDREWDGHIYNTRALVALGRHDYDVAATFLQRAHESHRLCGNEAGRALTLTNLSECYLNLGRLGAARRTCDAAIRLAKSHNRRRVEASGLILRGEILDSLNRPEAAKRSWRRATSIAKSLSDRDLKFKAEFALYRRAMRDNDDAVVRSIRRRLVRLSPWLPVGTEEVIEFQASIQSSKKN